MKKIAVLRCLRVSASCAGSGCLRAMNEKTGAFERYGDEDLQAVAFFTCNGCKENKLPNQEGSVTATRICRRWRFLPATAARKTSCPIRRAWRKR